MPRSFRLTARALRPLTPTARSSVMIYAPESMAELKVFLTASIGVQARHRMPCWNRSTCSASMIAQFA
jgi:hypothetical protein